MFSSLKSVYNPFEFYPESRAIYYFAQKFSMEALSAQHMHWNIGKISNFIPIDDYTAKPDKLYISCYQDRSVFCGHVKEIIIQDYVGRFDALLSKALQIYEDEEEKRFIILCSGSPYDISRSIEFVLRLRKKIKGKSSKIVMHPNLNIYLKIWVILICKFMRINCQFGFNNKLSKQSLVFTCGTSLFVSLKKTKFRVKNIGGANSQF